MARLSLSPEPNEWEQGRFRLRDDFDTSSDESSDEAFVSVDSNDDCEYSDSDDEYAHPIGFHVRPHASWGRTRFSLDPAVTPDLIEEEWENQLSLLGSSSSVHRFMQSYPPVHSYIDPKTASTASLLGYDEHMERKKRMQQENDKDMDAITQLLEAASLVESVKLLGPSPVRDPNETPLALLADTAHDIQQKMAMEKNRMQRHHQEAADQLKKLIDATHRKAQQILADEEKAEAERIRMLQEKEDANALRREKEKELQDAKAAADAKAAKELQDARDAADAAAAKKTEYLTKAEKLVVQLRAVRQSIEPFEKSKAVSKRRLNMKKVVRGKVNTLAENVEKIKSVAAEVGQAITVARGEDEELKKQLAAGNTQITAEMPRGKRYLMDLLASSIMIRVQAEGFNGLRGDGFPMANMLALLSVENKELSPILAAHIYTVCPTAIPRLPSVSADASEEEFMKSLGMQKDKKGEYETFDRFLLRTEGIISLVADIMASYPPQHRLMDGHKGAVDWLERFIGHLPEAPHSPLPLMTASVLDAFLTGAGHMLANKHPEEFKKHLDYIQNDIVERLDVGAIGQPSATRLKKTIKDGMKGFKKTLPSKALKELYYGADGSDGNVSIPPSVSQPSSFGGGGISTSNANPFSGGASSSNPSPFGGGGPSTSNPSPFGGAVSQPNSSAGSNPFGASSNNTAGPFGAGSNQQQSSFGGGGGFGGNPGKKDNRPPCKFFASGNCKHGDNCRFSHGGTSSSAQFGQQSGDVGVGNNENSMQDESNSNQTSNPFGVKPAFGGASPFGAPAPTGGNTPFGNSSMNAGPNPSSTPFGQPANPMGGGFGSAPAPSSGGFGSGFGASNDSSMGGFGSSNTSSGGFGSSNPSTNPSPFGGNTGGFGSSAPSNPSPFGQPSSAPSNPSPFGAPSSGLGSSTPFGSGGNNQQQSPFGGGGMQQQTPFGGGGMQQQSPFGSGGMNTQQTTPFGGGSNQQQTSFGGGGNRQQTPFGGGSNQQQTPFGGGGFGGSGGQGNKPPCKFFASGNCKFGDKCRFSHSGGGGGFGGGNAFGRRF